MLHGELEEELGFLRDDEEQALCSPNTNTEPGSNSKRNSKASLVIELEGMASEHLVLAIKRRKEMLRFKSRKATLTLTLTWKPNLEA